MLWQVDHGIPGLQPIDEALYMPALTNIVCVAVVVETGHEISHFRVHLPSHRSQLLEVDSNYLLYHTRGRITRTSVCIYLRKVVCIDGIAPFYLLECAR